MLALCAGVASCGGDGGDDAAPTLTWYTNPDNGGQEALAATCTEAAEGAYRIEISELPADATSGSSWCGGWRPTTARSI
jgi:multiple sugar transport system substrate-binding protein